VAGETSSLAPPIPTFAPDLGRRDRATRRRNMVLLVPAALLALLFLYYPLVFIVQLSFTVAASFL